MVRTFCVVALSLAAGCSRGATPREPASTRIDAAPAATSSAPAAASGTNEGVPPQPELERYFAEIDRARDVTTAAYAANQKPLVGFRGVVRRGQPFPGREFATARAYTMNHFAGARCGRAVLDDGRLAPCLSLPGVELDGQALESLLRAAQIRSSEPSTTLGVPVASHAYVFFDQNGTPVAELVVYGVHRWSLGDSDAPHDSVPRAARPLLLDACRKSGVGLCFADPEIEGRVWKEWEERHLERFGTDVRIRPRPLPVAPTSTMARLGEREKRLLCLWTAQHTSHSLRKQWRGRIAEGDSALEPLPEGQGHYERRLGWDECVQRFPSCEKPLAEVLPCQDHAQRGDALFGDRSMRARCEPVRHCIWGFATHSGREPPEIRSAPWE
ncbi:MAG TPA: hypothetical protein VKY73_15480 [Polyangiaceae bacterium]|nr:hypothetical protein [Polyangiaceae bacterium]